MKAFLLFVSETWVVTPSVGRTLNGFPTQGGPIDDREASLEDAIHVVPQESSDSLH